MAIQHWEPLREMVSLRDAMNSLLQESFVRPVGLMGNGTALLPLDIAETEDEFIVKASLPGVRPEDVHITAHGDTLTIRGEMKAEEEKKGGMAMSWSWKLGRIAAIDVYVHFTFFLLLGWEALRDHQAHGDTAEAISSLVFTC